MDHSYISVTAPLIPNRLETIKQKHIKKTSPLQRLDRVMDKALGVWKTLRQGLVSEPKIIL